MHEEEGGFIEQYLHLLGNPAHWAFEITLMILIDLLILTILVPWLIRRHDERKHRCDHES
jgi:hypothetical protein